MTVIEFKQQQLDVLGERALKFLAAASQVPTIRTALQSGGYSEQEHRAGWDLVLDLLGYRASLGSAGGNASVLRQREAAAQLDAWDGPNFERARAALDRSFPEQSAYIFDNLAAKSGVDSIAAVRTFVERYVALRDGSDPARKASRKQDKAAAELLSTRRIIDEEEVARLRRLIELAISLADVPMQTEVDPSARQQTAQKLDGWLRDWRTSARVLITRRDHQIRLGLVERRTAKGAPEEELPTEPPSISSEPDVEA
jgi:hypothetical protein